MGRFQIPNLSSFFFLIYLIKRCICSEHAITSRNFRDFVLHFNFRRVDVRNGSSHACSPSALMRIYIFALGGITVGRGFGAKDRAKGGAGAAETPGAPTITSRTEVALFPPKPRPTHENRPVGAVA